MKLKILVRSVALLLTLASLGLVASAKATTVYALTDTGSLLTFDHQTPGTITNNVAVTNLGGFTLLAIDVRPTVQPGSSNPGAGTLWAVGKSGTSFQLFVINPVTGVAAAVGVPIAAGITGVPADGKWGFDFNPTVDRIRLVNSTALDNNYRLNPNDGTLAFDDADLAFKPGDPNFGTTPTIDAAAYLTATFGGTTSLFYLDTALDILVKAQDANAGTLQTVGSLGVNIDEPNGFDIFNGLALFSVPGVTGSSLYSVNLTTGAATLVGAFPALTAVRGLAISISDPTPVPPGDSTAPVVKIFGKKNKSTNSGNFTLKIRATDDSGVVAVSYRVVKQSPSYKVIGQHGKSDIYTARLRRLFSRNNPVIVRAVDPSGNQTTVRVNIAGR